MQYAQKSTRKYKLFNHFHNERRNNIKKHIKKTEISADEEAIYYNDTEGEEENESSSIKIKIVNKEYCFDSIPYDSSCEVTTFLPERK